MRLLVLAACAACLCSPAFAADATEIDLVFKQDGLSIRLTGADCPIPLPHIAIPQVIPDAQIKLAHVQAGNRDQLACWAVDAENDVLIVTESGGGGWIPLKAFKATNGI